MDGAGGGGSEISRVAPAPRSNGAAIASIGGIGTSTGMITVGVARRVSSWWPGGSTCVTPTSPRTCGRAGDGAVGLDGLLLLAVDVAAQAPQAGLVAGVEAGRREDRLLDVALDDPVADERDVGVAGAAGARRVEHDGAHLVEERVPGREHDLAAAARARLG